jgi:CheY-like chemotaxis protein
MADCVRVLIADDDETFRCSTADLLRREGYACDEAADAQEAVWKLTAANYDVLVADIMMPGNSHFEFVRSLPQLLKGLPVIVVTAYPTVGTAIQSIQLPVMAYLTKPVDLDDLTRHVAAAVRNGQAYRGVRTARQRLQQWYGELEHAEQLAQRPSDGGAAVPVETFLSLSLRNIIGALEDMKELASPSPRSAAAPSPACHLLECPRMASIRSALSEAVAVLESTKTAFKSKELAQLRADLERLIIQIAE